MAPIRDKTRRLDASFYLSLNTGLRVQTFIIDETEDDADTYKSVKFIMCQHVHLANPATGRILGEDDD